MANYWHLVAGACDVLLMINKSFDHTHFWHKGKGLIYLQALSAKGWSPKGRRGKENVLPARQQVGFKRGTFWSTVE